MPCYHPRQAFFKTNQDGKKEIEFCGYLQGSFERGLKPNFNIQSVQSYDGNLTLPCGNCIGCRLERSRQWAIRCTHEASLYEDNCFITLTYSPEHLPSDVSLKKEHLQLFIKKLRFKFSDVKIRFFGCGEYGENFGRPHYHLCLFNFDFKDKLLWKSFKGFKYYTSSVLEDLWGKGHCIVGDLTFESAAYVARYCTKKITGEKAEEHYQGKIPEFAHMSLKPGIGYEWIKKFGETDVFPRDEVIVRGFKSKPPRYYDKIFEEIDPEGFDLVKERRKERALEKEDDNTHRRLLVKEKCQSARMKQLIRQLETDYDR